MTNFLLSYNFVNDTKFLMCFHLYDQVESKKKK